MAFGVSEAFSVGSIAFSIAGNFRKADELKKQLEAQRKLIALNNEAIIARREQQHYDNIRRQKIVSGSIVAKAGPGGVRASSGSIINAVADVAAQTAVDKMRINFNADIQLRENAIRSQELSRQASRAGEEAFINSIGNVLSLGAKFAER